MPSVSNCSRTRTAAPGRPPRPSPHDDRRDTRGDNRSGAGRPQHTPTPARQRVRAHPPPRLRDRAPAPPNGLPPADAAPDVQSGLGTTLTGTRLPHAGSTKNVACARWAQQDPPRVLRGNVSDPFPGRYPEVYTRKIDLEDSSE